MKKMIIKVILIPWMLSWMLASAQTPTLRVLHNFAAYGSASDGSIPYGSLAIDANGDLYGVTAVGGTVQCGTDYGCGTVFELNRKKNGLWTETILHSFAGGGDGAFPWGALLLDKTGNLYGTLYGDLGVAVSGIFELSPGPDGWSNTILSTENAGPGLASDRYGNLYGEMGPDQSHSGALGELSAGTDGWTYTQLYSFCPQYGCPDGFDPLAAPVFDARGNLWGTTWEGGIGRPTCADDGFGCGVIYVMTPNGDGTWTYHVMHRFASSASDGQHPVAGLTIDAAGNFYGTTEDGGPYGYGTIFKFAYRNGKWKASLLYDFANPQQGLYPEGTLALDQAGNLYGMAQGGTNSCGGLSCGVVYRLSPQTNGTWKYTVLVNLSETTGGVLPFYGLTLDGKGHMFGVTSFGGLYGGGTAFEITQ